MLHKTTNESKMQKTNGRFLMVDFVEFRTSKYLRPSSMCGSLVGKENEEQVWSKYCTRIGIYNGTKERRKSMQWNLCLPTCMVERANHVVVEFHICKEKISKRLYGHHVVQD
jgi:hypothetical protein